MQRSEGGSGADGSRRAPLKKGIDVSGNRSRRLEQQTSLRKKKIDEALEKRRRAPTESSSESAAEEVPSDMSDKISRIPHFAAMLYTDSPEALMEGTQFFRRLLSVDTNPPIAKVIQSNIVPRLVELLNRADLPTLQFEAAWTLTNVASGSSSDTKVVMEHGATEQFIKLLESPSVDVREQSVWALGNIAGDSTSCRDYVLSLGVMRPLLNQFRADERQSVLRNATWTLSNLCRGRPPPDFGIVSAALPLLAELLGSNDDEIVTDAAWAISYLSDGPNDKIDAVLRTGIVTRLVQLLMHPKPTVQTPILRVIGNIVTGSDDQTQAVINAGALTCLQALLSSNKKSIRKEACWTISNITAGTKEQITAVFQSNLIPSLIHILKTAEFDVKREAAWAISNATSGGDAAHIQYLIQQECMKPLVDLLDSSEPKIALVALEAIDHILKAGNEIAKQADGVNPFVEVLEQADGLTKLEQLQTHTQHEVYSKAMHILSTYFEEDNEEDMSVAPEQNSTTQTYEFSAPKGDFSFQ